MQKFVYVVLGLLASLGMLLGLVACQGGQEPVCNASLAEIAVVGGIDYLPGNAVAGYGMEGTALTQAELGPVFATITTPLQGCTLPTQGNFSTFLAVGTPLYTITGYRPSFRLAVKQATPNQDYTISLLEAVANPRASTGSELMQLDDNVTSMLLYPQSTPTSSAASAPLATADSPQQVAKLVALFDQAPVRATSHTGSRSDVLVFRFHDGTLSSLVYDPTTGWTNRGVILPSAFAVLLTGTGH